MPIVNVATPEVLLASTLALWDLFAAVWKQVA
jgi:hypothetical protein